MNKNKNSQIVEKINDTTYFKIEKEHPVLDIETPDHFIFDESGSLIFDGSVHIPDRKHN